MSKLPAFESPIRDRPHADAHFVEHHYVLRKGSWQDGAVTLAGLFPRDTRPERPAAWYQLLKDTHWPGQVPPGNGPFYVPEWVVEAIESVSLKEATGLLTSRGFTKVVAHVRYLPENGEYLAVAMRAAKQMAWNVNPRTYRAYLYPTLGTGTRALRPYTTSRYRLG